MKFKIQKGSLINEQGQELNMRPIVKAKNLKTGANVLLVKKSFLDNSHGGGYGWHGIEVISIKDECYLPTGLFEIGFYLDICMEQSND